MIIVWNILLYFVKRQVSPRRTEIECQSKRQAMNMIGWFTRSSASYHQMKFSFFHFLLLFWKKWNKKHNHDGVIACKYGAIPCAFTVQRTRLFKNCVVIGLVQCATCIDRHQHTEAARWQSQQCRPAILLLWFCSWPSIALWLCVRINSSLLSAQSKQKNKNAATTTHSHRHTYTSLTSVQPWFVLLGTKIVYHFFMYFSFLRIHFINE